ncbi:DUF3967 domain-containing protein [Bacillus cereus group sp. N6]
MNTSFQTFREVKVVKKMITINNDKKWYRFWVSYPFWK